MEELRTTARLALQYAAAEANIANDPEQQDEGEEDREIESEQAELLTNGDSDIEMVCEEEDILPNPMGKVESPAFEAADIEQFQLGLALFADQASLSRVTYEALTELLSTVTDLKQLKNLPKCLDTLKKRYKKAVPMIPVCKKIVPVIPSKLPTLPEQERKQADNSTRPMFFIDPLRSMVRHLKRGDFAQRNYVGVGRFCAHPKELWESNVWCSSVRTSSGDLTRYPGSEDRIIPSDIIMFRCQKASYMCRSSANHFGRIVGLGKQRGIRCVKIQMVATKQSPLLSRMNASGMEERV